MKQTHRAPIDVGPWAMIALAFVLWGCDEAIEATDGGFPVDGSTEMDAGPMTDAGGVDASTRMDASTPPDATTSDSGAPSGDFEYIPDVPFDVEQIAGTTTSTGPLPATLGAGQVHELEEQSISRAVSIECSGTEDQPAFIIGGALVGPELVNIRGSWCIFEGTEFRGSQARTNGDHIIFRGVEVHGSTERNGMNLSGSSIVVVESHIHHNQTVGRDAHGIQVGVGTNDVWILENDIHHNSGNGLQACHNCDPAPRGIYIGNNVFHSDREVGVGLKYADQVIIEGNVFHSYQRARADTMWCFDDGSLCGTWTSGSDGSGIVVGSDGATLNVTIAYNEFFDVVNAVRVEESDGVQLIGNDMHDIEARCLALDKQGEGIVFRGNTCASAQRGIWQNWRENFSLTVEDNVFRDVAEPAIEYEARSVCEASTLTANRFIASGPVICGNTTATTADDINALPGASGNQVE